MMQYSNETADAKAEAQQLRSRLKALVKEMREQGPAPHLLDDYSHVHRRLVHLQDHYSL